MSGNLDWLTVRPATALGYERGYVDLPAFSYPAPWHNASEAIHQYNFGASLPFVLRSRPTKPSGANYVLAIRYRVGQTIYRWKLWDHDDAVMDQVPLYDPAVNVIKPNFVLEVWNVSSSATVDQAEAIRLFTSIKRAPVSIYSVGDYALATGVLVYPLTSSPMGVEVPTPTLLKAHYRAPDYNGDTGAWPDLSGNGFNLAATGAIPVKARGAYGNLTEADRVQFTDGGDALQALIGAPFAATDLFCTFLVSTGNTGNPIIAYADTIDYASGIFLSHVSGASEVLRLKVEAEFGDMPMIFDTPLIAHMHFKTGQQGYLKLYDSSGNLLATVNVTANSQTRGLISVGPIDGEFSEIMLYANPSAAQIESIIAYMKFGMPLVFADGVEGGDNAA